MSDDFSNDEQSFSSGGAGDDEGSGASFSADDLFDSPDLVGDGDPWKAADEPSMLQPDGEVIDSKSTDEEAAEVEAAPEEQSDAGDEKPPASQTPPSKQLQFKVGDKMVALDETAIIEWKVDGKPAPVAVKDLLQNYAGKVAWDKRLNEVALERKAVRTEKETFDGDRERHKKLILDLHTKTREGKMLEAVSSLVQMTGLKVDPREYVKQLRESLVEQAQQLAQMSPEDRARYELQEEREYLRSQQQHWEQQQQAEQARKAFEQRVAKVTQESGMSADEFSETYSWLKGQVKANGGDPNAVTPEYVAQHTANKKAYETARDAIRAVEPDLIAENGTVKDEARRDKLAALVKAHPEFTPEEFAEMYRESRKSKLATTVSKKVQKAPTPTAATAALRAKPKQQREVNVLKAEYSEEDLRW
jgi:hypothetical protein